METTETLRANYFKVDWHSGARPSHAVWQGKVYTKEELETVCGLGTVTVLNGANCYHIFYPFFPGISKRKYSDRWIYEQNKKEQVKRMWKGKEYNSYEAKQRQRYMETAMRAQRQKIRLFEEVNLKKDDIIIAKCRYQAQKQEYLAFAKAMGKKPQLERVYIDGLGRIVVSDKAKKNVENKRKSGIINDRKSKKNRKLIEIVKDRIDDKDRFTGEKIFILEDTVITDCTTIAADEQIRDLGRLTELHGGKGTRWEKRAGKILSKKYMHDVHWYTNQGRQIDMKIKVRKERKDKI